VDERRRVAVGRIGSLAARRRVAGQDARAVTAFALEHHVTVTITSVTIPLLPDA
jgi:hypothetical protein